MSKKDLLKFLKEKIIILVLTFLFCLAFFFLPVGLLAWLMDKIFFFLCCLYLAVLGIIAGGLAYVLVKDKGEIIIDDSENFLNFCQNSDSLVFFGPIGQGKTALMAWLSQNLSSENKYATFPCHLPWANIAQFDFSAQPTEPLGVKEVIFLDEINLLFKGNEFLEAREERRFLSHFFALSRHQGTKIIVNGQRLGQVWIELREVATAVCRVEKLSLRDEGLYVKVRILMATAWETIDTNREYIVFISRVYLDTYNSTWLKGLKYLRTGQGYV